VGSEGTPSNPMKSRTMVRRGQQSAEHETPGALLHHVEIVDKRHERDHGRQNAGS
jgi:hypothetical protein